MTTLNDLRQRLENQYLEPVIEETATVPIQVSIDNSEDMFKIGEGILSPDEESYIGPGRLLELDNELVRILNYDSLLKEVTCVRGARGTTKVSHDAATAECRIPTRWTRETQLQSLRDAIASLWKPLFVEKEQIASVSAAEYVPLPLTTVRALVEYETDSGEWASVGSRLVATHPLESDRAAVFISSRFPYDSALCIIRYGVRIAPPDDPTETIENLPANWERIILADAAAELLSGVDIDATTQERLTEQIQAEGFPVTSGSRISQNLIRYREYLVDQEKAELTAKTPKKVSRKPLSLWG
ncbi:MAG: hypothetical protein ABFR89_02485 [Actinomycetota bacterium]